MPDAQRNPPTREGRGASAGRDSDATTPQAADQHTPIAHIAEPALLGSCLLIPEAAYTIARVLVPSDFDREAHRTVFEAVQSLVDDDAPCDTVSTTVRLADQGRLDHVGGAVAVYDLTEPSATSPAAWTHYLSLVERESNRRSLRRAYLAAIRDLDDGADPSRFRLPSVVVPV